jgi:arylsulfatase A-like enzyme
MTQVVIVVFDGLNPELVTPGLMPHLSAFAGEGVRLGNHRPVFPSATRLNAASMVTGCFPGTHGLHGNLSLVPEYHPSQPMDALEPQLSELVQRGGRVLLVPTLAEVLAEDGMEYVAAGVGTSGQAFIHHPNGEHGRSGATIHTDFALPRPLYEEMIARFGPWPEKAIPNSPRTEHVTTLFTEYVLGERDPAVALLWFSEPDSSEHDSGLNSPATRQAAHDADAQFGRLLEWLNDTGRSAVTNVLVTCDHGQATVIESVPLARLLLEQGFAAPGEPQGVVVAGNGGGALFYVQDHDHTTVDRLARWLMSQRWAGPLLASENCGPIEGTLPARLLGLEGPRAPDLFLSFAWREGLNEHGQPGYVYSSGGRPGMGTHGSMSPWEFRTFTVARGPAFKRGMTVPTATGHSDLAPTILRVLGLEVPPHMEGRVIEEMLSGGPEPHESALERRTASREFEGGRYLQEVVFAPGGHGGHLVEARYAGSAAKEPVS